MSENSDTWLKSFATMPSMPTLSLSPTQCYAAMQAHDSRFDGRFFVGVSSTKVYCRPICRVRMPKIENCSFYPHAVNAEQAGYRPCLKCRPELAPGNAQMDRVKQTAQHIAERIKLGALNDSSVEILAEEFAISSRQLRRVIESEFGVSPVALAQSHRLLLAKQLLTDSNLKVVDVAFASGFSSLRQFNNAFKTRYRLNPTELRKYKPVGSNASTDIVLRLGYRPPLAWQTLINFLASRGGSQLEKIDGDKYYRIVSIQDAVGWITAEPDKKSFSILVTVSPSLLGYLPTLQHRLRQLFDLDAEPTAIEKHLSRDKLLKKLIVKAPGLRVPGVWSSFEVALRAVLGQQVSVKAATTLFGRFVNAYGTCLQEPFAGLTHSEPNVHRIAASELQDLINLGLTQRRAATIKQMATLVAAKQLNLDSLDDSTELEKFLAIPGIGPWTAQYVAMRAGRDPNAILPSDLGVMKALAINKPQLVLARTETWQPWRAYGAMHLWNGLNTGG